MTDQERYAAFVEEYENLCNKRGFQIAAQLNSEMLGAVLQVRPTPIIIPIQGWVEKPDSTVGKTHDSEKGAEASNLAQKE